MQSPHVLCFGFVLLQDDISGEFSSLPQVQQKISDIEVREKEIFDWRKKVTEAECKLKQQENQLDSVVSEKNLYSKNLVEAQVPMT